MYFIKPNLGFNQFHTGAFSRTVIRRKITLCFEQRHKGRYFYNTKKACREDVRLEGLINKGCDFKNYVTYVLYVYLHFFNAFSQIVHKLSERLSLKAFIAHRANCSVKWACLLNCRFQKVANFRCNLLPVLTSQRRCYWTI